MTAHVRLVSALDPFRHKKRYRSPVQLSFSTVLIIANRVPLNAVAR